MKKTIGVVMLLLTLCSVSFAQKEKRSPEKQMESRMKHMKKELHLTDEQAARVSKLMQEQNRKQRALAEEMKINRKNSKAELKSILTQEQYIQLLEKQAQRGTRKRHHARRSGGVERG
jgi:Spy/CpxP family protein refolding chaperone